MSVPCKTQWTYKWKCCQQCGTKSKKGKYKHKGNGLCNSCFDKKRAKNPKRKLALKNQHDKWYNRVKGTEQHKLYSKKTIYEWQKSHPLKYKSNWKRAHIRSRFKKVIAGKSRLKNGLTYFCEECNKNVFTSISLEMEQGKQSTQLGLFQDVSILNPKLKKAEIEREQRRYKRQKESFEKFKDKTLLGNLNTSKARDVLWAFTGRDIYRMLVIERGWSSDDYEKWLASILVQTLLKQKESTALRQRCQLKTKKNI